MPRRRPFLKPEAYEPLHCERCKQLVMALVQVKTRTDEQWWCYSCHVEVRDAQGK